MGVSTQLIAKAAKNLGIPFDYVDTFHAVLLLHFPKKDHLVINTKLGLISNAEEYMGRDKAFQHEFLKQSVNLPKTNSYLDARSKYGKFAKFNTQEEIVTDILDTFKLPVIIKKNQGAEGENVFLAANDVEVKNSVERIFDLNSSNYDFVLLAQEYIRPVYEYRIVVYKKSIALTYLKDTSEALFTGNLSPLHWEQARALPVTDNVTLANLASLCQKIFEKWPIEFAGLDVIQDEAGKMWLIELNTAPSLAMFVRDNGEVIPLALYAQILEDLKEKYV